MAPPPGYVSYGTAPTPTSRVSRIGGLATSMSIIVGIAALGGILSAFLSTALRGDAEDLLAGQISESEFTDSLVGLSAFSAVAGIATLAAMVLVMIWMYRITSNLKAFGMTTTWHPLFAIFGWFLPPLVLYIIPFLMLREQWSKSQQSAVAGQPVGDTERGENPVLWIWLLAFGIWPFISLVLSANSFLGNITETDATAIAEDLLDTSQSLALVGYAISLVAAVTWIVFVRQLTRRHRTLTGEQ